MLRKSIAGWSAAALAPIALAAFTAGCSRGPVLRAEEAVPQEVMELDEATDMVSKRHLSNFKLCVQRSKLVDDSALFGKPLDVVFTIGSGGQADQVKIVSPAFKGSAFASCIQRILTWIRFPDPGEHSRQVRLRIYLDEEQPLRHGS
jgi:hypothetical protein